MPEIKIAPSLLSCDFSRIGEEVKQVCEAGADLVHVDVMDGHFVPNLTIGLPIISAVKAHSAVPVDVHLMITNAEDFLDDYAHAGADIISVHVEACTHLHRALDRIRQLGKKASVVVNPATPVMSLLPVIDMLDMVLLMTVNPGFGGQTFIENVLHKVSWLRNFVDKKGYELDIQVDGGIKVENAAQVSEAGANVLVSGSGIFKQADYARVISHMRSEAQSGHARRSQRD